CPRSRRLRNESGRGPLRVALCLLRPAGRHEIRTARRYTVPKLPEGRRLYDAAIFDLCSRLPRRGRRREARQTGDLEPAAQRERAGVAGDGKAICEDEIATWDAEQNRVSRRAPNR